MYVKVSSKDKAPKVEHWAIFKFSVHNHTIYTENDSEIRSTDYEAYTSRQEWLDEIASLEKTGQTYYACIVKPVTIKAQIMVTDE